jgi:hypothetical protein
MVMISGQGSVFSYQFFGRRIIESTHFHLLFRHEMCRPYRDALSGRTRMVSLTLRSSIFGARRILVRIAGRPVLFREAHCLKDAWGHAVATLAGLYNAKFLKDLWGPGVRVLRKLVAHLENGFSLPVKLLKGCKPSISSSRPIDFESRPTGFERRFSPATQDRPKCHFSEWNTR